MNFVRVKDYIINATHISCIIESSDNKELHIEFCNSDQTVSIPKYTWNKAVREAGVPSLQWFDK